MSVSEATNLGSYESVPIMLALSYIVTEGSQVEETNIKMESLIRLDACRPIEVKVHEDKWARVVTPLKLSEWEKALAPHPDREFTRFICSGIRDGFRIGFDRIVMLNVSVVRAT